MEKENLESEFVPCTFALRMKTLGFDEPCFNLYNFKTKELLYPTPEVGNVRTYKYDNHNETSHISAPTWRQAFKWFRDEHKLDYSIIKNNLTKKYRIFEILLNNEYIELEEDFEDREYKLHEEAELACMVKLLDIVETKLK